MRSLRSSLGAIATRLAGDRGSAPAEFVMVAALLTLTTLSVLQLGLALHVKNTVLDAAAEGARYGALADNTPADGAARTRELITVALGAGYAADVTATVGSYLDHPAVAVTVRTPLPLIGLVGIDEGLEVTGHAARETLD
jgi:Flp pilus assembly protein TadG